MNKVMDVEVYEPRDGDRYFFDSNIWLYFYCPIGDCRKSRIRKYDGFLKKIIHCDTTIYFSSLIISEIVNRWLRLDFNRARKKEGAGIKDFKRHYRGSEGYLDIVKDIESVFSTQLLKISTPLDDCATEISISEALTGMGRIDFNNCYYHHLARLNNLLMVTDDADFAGLDTGISILTANRRLLDADRK